MYNTLVVLFGFFLDNSIVCNHTSCGSEGFGFWSFKVMKCSLMIIDKQSSRNNSSHWMEKKPNNEKGITHDQSSPLHMWWCIGKYLPLNFGKVLRTTTTITTTFTFEILKFFEPHMDGGALGDICLWILVRD